MIILSVLALLPYATIAEAQYSSRFSLDDFNPFPSGFGIFPSRWNPFPDGFPFPRFPTFPDFSNFFGPEWWKKVDEHITELMEKTRGENGIRTVNGTTVITQEIGGKTYTVTVPENGSYSLVTNRQTENGKTVSTVKLTVNGKTEVYTTKDGKTTVTDGDGKPVENGGFFGVVETSEPQITAVPASTDSPEGKTEPTQAPSSAPSDETETKTTSEQLETPEPSQNPEVVNPAPTTPAAPAVDIVPSTPVAPDAEKEAQESNSITTRPPTRGDRK
ncbi:hypothetical protein Y032_0001g192 [Ancylostoma ceylanicum]|uniref:Uncharacterized protein n=1 Tax=Ancylostoma ceylanicum TaxID=53326 RepID=A0A016W2Y3_9BILA|nr:hypothetical protein Y032_0001g192 [Ancylostoma ceylanicum]